jgi:hypothetical protein
MPRKSSKSIVLEIYPDAYIEVRRYKLTGFPTSYIISSNSLVRTAKYLGRGKRESSAWVNAANNIKHWMLRKLEE